MTKQLLQLEQANLYFTKTGTGTQVLIAFHGFGQTHEIFNELALAVSDRYTLYSFDLFFHGKSTWTLDEQPLEKKFWKLLIHQFLKAQQIDTFSLLGFSMGGKFALTTLEAFPEQVKEIFLLAPDGIKTSMWYSLATYPTVLRNLFRSMIVHPQRFTSIARFAYRIRLIDKGQLRFVESQMNTEEKRNRVYYSWVVFRHLKFNLDTIARDINEHGIRLVMIVGKYDNVIPAKNMHVLLRKVKHYQFEIPETGHNGVIDSSIKILRK